MTTAQQVFDIAIHMMDEQNETTGATVTGDTEEYRLRTLSILNAVMPSLYPYSDTYDSTKPGRPVCPVLSQREGHNAPDLTQQIPGRYPCHGRAALRPGGPSAGRGE